MSKNDNLQIASQIMMELQGKEKGLKGRGWKWQQGVVLWPEVQCPWCKKVVKSKGLWKVDEQRNHLVGQTVPKEGQRVGLERSYHPHVHGGSVCMGSARDVQTALWRGLNPGNAYSGVSVKDWLRGELWRHDCEEMGGIKGTCVGCKVEHRREDWRILSNGERWCPPCYLGSFCGSCKKRKEECGCKVCRRRGCERKGERCGNCQEGLNCHCRCYGCVEVPRHSTTEICDNGLHCREHCNCREASRTFTRYNPIVVNRDRQISEEEAEALSGSATAVDGEDYREVCTRCGDLEDNCACPYCDGCDNRVAEVCGNCDGCLGGCCNCYECRRCNGRFSSEDFCLSCDRCVDHCECRKCSCGDRFEDVGECETCGRCDGCCKCYICEGCGGVFIEESFCKDCDNCKEHCACEEEDDSPDYGDTSLVGDLPFGGGDKDE